MKHRRIGGMPGQTSPVSDDGVSDAARNVVVSIIRKKVEKMLPSVGDKPAHKSGQVRGALVRAGGLVLGTIAAVMQGEASWSAVIEAFTNPIVYGAILAGIGDVWSSIGNRRAVAKSGIPTESK